MAVTPQLRSAIVCDALDALGLRSQALGGLPAPLVPGTCAAGPALPLEVVIVEAVPEVPYRGLLAALDAVPRGAVVVTSAHGRQDVALWGELLSTICLARGAAGVVCDGPVRDVAQIRELGLPVFASGAVPYDINGRLEVLGHTRPITAGGLAIAPGDLVVADDDGVVVVPVALIDEVLARVAAKAQGESGFLDAIRAGAPASEAFERFRVL